MSECHIDKCKQAKPPPNNYVKIATGKVERINVNDTHIPVNGDGDGGDIPDDKEDEENDIL